MAIEDDLVIHSRRLILRRWRESDFDEFASMNADPLVMEHFPRLYGREESDGMVRRMDQEFDECGFGLWALERRDRAEFIGFCGLHRVGFEAGFTPAVEIGWRLARHSWGLGLASEAAREALKFGFMTRGLTEIVSFTIAANERSEALMRRIGMKRDEEGDFDHPWLAGNERMCRHILYRLTSADWLRENLLTEASKRVS